MQQIQVPRYLDEPPMFLLWSIDEAMPVLILLGIGMFIKQLMICLLLGIVFSRLYRKYVEGKPKGFISYAMYWWGVLGYRGSRTIPDALQREFLP